MISAFIFDIDGTLIDSNDFHAKAWSKAFAVHGKQVSFAQVRPHIGKGSDQILPMFLKEEEVKSLGEAISKSRERIFKREYLSQIRPFPKVRELFKKIRESGAHIALASSAKAEEVEAYKTIAQIGDLIEKTTSSDDAKESKPEPDIFHSAMSLLGNPHQGSVLVVGDTPYDAVAARKAKLRVIGVLSGGFSEAELKMHGCQATYRDPADLLENLNQLLNL